MKQVFIPLNKIDKSILMRNGVYHLRNDANAIIINKLGLQ